MSRRQPTTAIIALFPPLTFTVTSAAILPGIPLDAPVPFVVYRIFRGRPKKKRRREGTGDTLKSAPTRKMVALSANRSRHSLLPQRGHRTISNSIPRPGRDARYLFGQCQRTVSTSPNLTYSTIRRYKNAWCDFMLPDSTSKRIGSVGSVAHENDGMLRARYPLHPGTPRLESSELFASRLQLQY